MHLDLLWLVQISTEIFLMLPGFLSNVIKIGQKCLTSHAKKQDAASIEKVLTHCVTYPSA